MSILGVSSVSNGTAVLSTIGVSYGPRTLTARYGGDSNNMSSVSAGVVEHIGNKPGGVFAAGTGTAYLESSARPTALADFNHDGNSDLVALGNESSRGVWVYLGNGDGTLQSGQSYFPDTPEIGAVVADVNMDGIPDLLVTGQAGLYLLTGNGDGTFAGPTLIVDADDITAIAAADINADGKPDLVFLRQSVPAVEILYGAGDGTFQTSSPSMLSLASAPYALLVADLNRDGAPDIVVVSGNDNHVTVFLGTGPGTFGAPQQYLSYGASSLATGDLNNDGVPDLLVGSETATFDLFLGNGDGTFGAAQSIPYYGGLALTIGAYPSAVFDFDGDGNADVIAGDANGNLFVFLGNGDGTFKAPLQFLLAGSDGSFVTGDFNHDGIADLMASGFPPAVQPWLGALAPVFTVTPSPYPANAGQAVTLLVTCNRADATGTLTFENIEGTGTPLGTAPLVNGSASLNLGAISIGPYIIHGTYSGDTKYSGTNLPPVYLVGDQSIGKLGLTVTPNPAVPGQAVTMTVTIPSKVGNAQISFFDGTTLLNSQTLYSQTATFTTELSAGVHQLTALFPAYIGYLPTSTSVIENVIAAPGGAFVPGLTDALGSHVTQAIAMDFNRDGLLDLGVLDPTNQQVTILLNQGQGIFGAPTEIPLGFAPGAIVATGINLYSNNSEFAVTNPAGNQVVVVDYTAPGIQSIASYPVGTQPAALATADFDGDGRADLVTANAGSNNVSLILSSLPHPISQPAGNDPVAIVTGDFDHDGKADFAVANKGDNNVMVFLGNGDGSFKAPVTTAAGSSPTILLAGDLDGDFKTDLVALGGASNQVTVLLSTGSGGFHQTATYTLGSAPMSATLADVTGDSRLDLLVATASGLEVFNGNGDGTFGSAQIYSEYAGAGAVVAAPFSGDSRMDLAITVPATESVSLLVNGQPTTTTLSVTPALSTLSGRVTLTATVAPAGATGFAAFYDGAIPIGGGPVSNSTASFSTALLLPGAHSLSARFTGGPGYGSSLAAPVAVNVVAVPSIGLLAPTRQTFPNDFLINLISGDFNNDGIEDFALWRQGNGLIVLLGNGDGTFKEAPPELSSGGAPAITADFNNDGQTDLAFINGALTIALGQGAGEFRDLTAEGAGVSIATADFNGDGRADVVMANPAGTADVLLGIGDGTFQGLVSYPAGASPSLVATGDLNRDGSPDIVVANTTGQVNVLLGKGDGTFSAPQALSISGVPVSMAVADINADGLLDIAMVETGTNTAIVMLGNGDGTFRPPNIVALGGVPSQLLCADIDGDGHQDLVVMYTGADPAFAVFYGNGDGTFGPPVNYSDIQPGAAIAVGDVNRDGSLDVVVAESNTLNVFQAIQLALSPTAIYLDSTSQTSSLIVSTNSPTLAWAAAASGGFITLNSGTGTGKGTVTFTVTANTTGADRTGSITLGRQTVSILQRANSQIFTDVTPADYYFDFVGLLDTDGITGGCQTNPAEYCPNDIVTRGEMAVFLVTAVMGGNNFDYTAAPYFTDVPASNPFFKFIQKLKDLGITGGCTPTEFCPDSAVTRDEMAAFIIRARYENTPYTYPAVPYFSDEPSTDPFYPFVQKMAQDGITSGCGDGMYCPQQSLPRGQMAVFIATGLLNQLLPSGSGYISGASPNSVTPGESLVVTLTGVNTNFVAGSTQVTVAPGITASNLTVLSPTTLTLQLTVGVGMAANPTSIIVSTGNQEADLPNGFVVR